MTQTGILLINLGTPERAEPKAVYRYLTQFLNDPRVIDLSAWARWLLTNLIIVPFRHRQSAAAYQKIWTPQGSPLLVNGRKLQAALSEHLGSGFQVELAMRYAKPSIPSTLAQMKACTKIVILPLFPQYSSAATGSALEAVLKVLAASWNIPSLVVRKDFYNHPGFIAAFADQIAKTTADQKIDHYLFSYHGLPERHLTKSECRAACSHLEACPAITDANAYCYRAQCYATTKLIAQSLKLSPSQYSVAFQSRLGRTPWIKPYTDLVLPELGKAGVKSLAVVCPSFVADCLETLEEISIRARVDWQALGGESFHFVPCLNDNPIWVEALAGMILE